MTMLSWPVWDKPHRTVPMQRFPATCDLHGPTTAHTGLHPWRDGAGTIRGWQTPVYADCCNRYMGLLR